MTKVCEIMCILVAGISKLATIAHYGIICNKSSCIEKIQTMIYFRSISYELLQILFIFLLVSQASFCQTLPIQKIDSSFVRDSNELIINERIKEYDEYIVYTNYSAWTKDHISYFLGSKNGKWKAIRFFIDYKTDHYTAQKKYKIKEKKISIKDSQIDDMFEFVNSNGFWELQKDSLFQRELKLNDSVTEILVVTDGSTDQIFISSDKKFYSINAYLVDYYQNIIPNRQKSIFILSRNKFISLFKKKK